MVSTGKTENADKRVELRSERAKLMAGSGFHDQAGASSATIQPAAYPIREQNCQYYSDCG